MLFEARDTRLVQTRQSDASRPTGNITTEYRFKAARMFNAPRLAQRYGTTPINGLGSSFVDENPLAVSIYDDPWSAAPSPSPPPVNTTTSAFSSVIGNILGNMHLLVLTQSVFSRCSSSRDVPQGLCSCGHH
jgi:hypothetical protein